MTEYPEDYPTLSAGPPPVMYSDHVYDYPSSEHHDSSRLSWPIIVAVIGACVAVIAVVIAATVVLTSPTRTSSEPATVISIATPVAPSTVTSVSTVVHQRRDSSPGVSGARNPRQAANEPKSPDQQQFSSPELAGHRRSGAVSVIHLMKTEQFFMDNCHYP